MFRFKQSRLRAGATVAMLLVAGVGLLTGAAPGKPEVARGLDRDLRSLNFAQEIPPDAEVELLEEEDGFVLVVTSAISGEDLREYDTLAIGATKHFVNSSDGVVTTVTRPSAACTITTSMKPVSAVLTNPDGKRRLSGEWKMTRSASCEKATWRAEMWGSDPFWGSLTLAKKHETTTHPGSSTSVFFSFNCKGTDSKYWKNSMRYKAGFTIQDSSVVSRRCQR